jgi:putative alpha-1,2-mannosidase
MPMPTLDRRLLIAFAATAMLASGAVLAAPSTSAAERAYGSVDPFIGTGGEGHTYPGATVPFGMVQLSPDTRIQPREKAYGWAAGYRYDDSSIVGFSHTHFSGTGHSDLGDILLMPFTGNPAWSVAIPRAAQRLYLALSPR